MNRAVTIRHVQNNTHKPWQVRWYSAPDEAGRQQHPGVSFVTKREAEQFKRKKEVEIDEGRLAVRPKGITLDKLCSDFVNLKRTKRPGTLTLYENTIRRLKDYFSPDMSLKKITPHLADNFVASMRSLEHGDELSSSSKHRILRHCRTIFKKAVVWQWLTGNPFKNVDAIKVVTRDWHHVTTEEYKRLLAVTPTLRRKCLYSLAYRAGLRLGELVSLCWANIDFENGEVAIENRLAAATTPPFFVKDTDARTIPLPSDTVDLLCRLRIQSSLSIPYVLIGEERYKIILKKWKTYQQNKRPWANRDWSNNALPNFKRDCKHAGIKPAQGKTLNVHGLRKAAILAWAQINNNVRVTQEWAGHSSIATTMKYYSKVTPEQTKKAMAELDRMLA